MPRTREQFKEMKDERKSSILSAALILFSTSEKVSIDSICEKLKCSHGIIYHYFSNVNRIYDCLLASENFKVLKSELFDQNEGSSYDKIEHIFSVCLDVSQKDKEKVAYLNILIKDKEKGSLYSLLSKFIKDGQAAGSVIGGEPSQIVDSLFLLLKGLYLSLLLEKHPDVKVPSLETVMQLIRKPTNFSRQTL